MRFCRFHLINASLFLYLSFVCQAQEIDMKWSVEEEYPAKSPEPISVGHDDEFLYLYKGTQYGALMFHYLEVVNRKTLKKERQIKLDASTLPNVFNQRLSRIFFDGDKFFLFTEQVQGEIFRLYGSTIDKSGKTLLEGKLLEEIDNRNKKNVGDMQVISNPTSSDFLIYADVPTNKKEYSKIEYKLVDESFKTLYERELTLPYLDKEFHIQSTYVDKKGIVYLIANKDDKSAPNESVNVIFYYSLPKGTYGELKLPLANRINSGLNVSFDESDNLIVSGLYTNNDKVTKFREGIFYVKMQSETGKVLESATTKFDVSSLKTLGKRIVKENAISESFYVNYIYNLESGGRMYILELAQDILVTNNYKVTLECYRSHMLVVKVDEKGNEEWMAVVPKEQRISIPQSTVILFIPKDLSLKYDKLQQLLSFTPIFRNNKMYLLYNDHVDNLEIKDIDDTRTTKFNGATACFMAEIDEKGKVSRKILFKAKDQGFWITPSNSEQLDDNQVLMFSYFLKDRKAKIGIMDLH